LNSFCAGRIDQLQGRARRQLSKVEAAEPIEMAAKPPMTETS
jgi:hypothetical protein